MTLYPLLLLVLGIALILVLILYLKLNAFLALISAALVVGLLSPEVTHQWADGEPGKGPLHFSLLAAPKQVAFAFGELMGKIGILIALATIVGKALMDSGGADRIVRAFTRLFGERNASWALLVSGFVLAVPVFFDTVFFLLVPLAKALRLRTGANYLLYVIAIGAGGAVTHSLVPPTPGPITMSKEFGVDLGITIMAGVLVGIPISLVGYFYARWADKRWPIPLRQVGDVTIEELEESVRRPDEDLPSLFLSFLPIVLPVILITTATIFNSLAKVNPGLDAPAMINGVAVSPSSFLNFFGEPYIALFISAMIALWMVARQKGLTKPEVASFTAKALDEAGMILLITCAGGAFGAILRQAGVGDALNVIGQEYNISLLVLAWGLAVIFKIAQGSGTVSMTSTAGIVAGIATTGTLGYHPVYLIMAIGCGSLVGSWMNDSGFWVVCKMSGMTEAETFKSWTVTLIAMGVAGLPLVFILSRILPMV